MQGEEYRRMLLTKLEIKGFKSFGDKVTVHFDKGITGIVGPNGCGKSNIVDAIRWVLGEQSTKALRSEKMENVIFNGTKNRKALQMAEVSLSFDNTKNILPTEYSSVTITRRYYRSGDSEYLLNNVPCRLKDITSLFLDTGIGSDSYAIIELKMVDEILNDKDNSRRELFEEAAGISKFKIRKRETLRKLDDTDKDLDRVEDLLFEIEKNLKSLEKQAKQAEKYKQVREEYKGYSISLADRSIQKHKENFDRLQKRIEEENTLRTKSVQENANFEADIEKHKTELLKREHLLSSRQKTLNEQVNKIRQYESDKKIRNERLRYLNDKMLSLRESINLDKLKAERGQTDIERLKDEQVAITKTLDEIAKKLDSLKGEQEDQKEKTTVFQEQLNKVNLTFREEQDALFQLRKSLEISEMQLDTFWKELDKTSSDNLNHSENIRDLEESLVSLSSSIDSENKVLDALVKTDSDTQQKIIEAESLLEEKREKLAVLNREIDSKENEYSLTKSLVDNLEGFPEAIKFLKKNTHWSKETPLLSDILTCEEEYRVSIENYLEQYMNYYIVESVAQAYQAVNLLSESAKGKANFFVLDSFETLKKTSKSNPEIGIPAINIVEYDAKYANLVQYLLGSVYVITHENDNIPLDRSEIFITQNGKIIHRKNSISGGSVGLFEGKRIGRAKNLEVLQKKIKDLTIQKDHVKTDIDRIQNDILKLKTNSVKSDIETCRKNITQLNEQYIGVKTRHEQLNLFLHNNITKKEDLQNNIRILEDGIQQSKPTLHLKEIALEDINTQIKQIQTEWEYQNELLIQKSNAFNQENIRFHQQQNRQLSIEKEILYKEQNLVESYQNIEKNTEDLARTDEEIKVLVETTEFNDDELLDLYKEKESIELGVNEAEKEYYEIRGHISELEKNIREIHRKRENGDTILIELQNSLNETKLALASIKERLMVEFEVDLDQLLLGETTYSTFEELDDDQLRAKVEKARDVIHKMGPINPMALEAYEEIKQRYDFIVLQRKDLIEAKKSLLSTIHEIDEVAKASFTDTFNKVKENFINVFRSLFTDEDTCNLTLVDPSNPLESAIEITAKPKGKRPLTINQLSGGEKTLTAVALLFAIYLIKPAPFCIFDEVDAPLDDANIDKFNNIIRTFSADSQFILVTHNKRTMSMTDIIYGVTMQEVGVSRLVPVDLRAFD